LIKNSNITPNINGSVGMEIAKPILIFLTFIANGVSRTIRKINLSREKKYNRRINKTAGIRESQ
jgi:hypothetical protein